MAPDPPGETDGCRECQLNINHICLHSLAPSDVSSVSTSSLRRAHLSDLPPVAPVLPPSFPPAPPILPPGAHRQPYTVNQWVQHSEAGAGHQDQLFTGAAAAGPLPNYAESVMSSVASRHGLSVTHNLKALTKAIGKMKTAGDKGEKKNCLGGKNHV